MKYICWLYI